MKKLIVLVFSIVLFGSCSKYDDNPAISLSSKKSRLVGTWEIDIRGSTVVESHEKFSYTFNEGGDFNRVLSNSDTDEGEWEFSSDKETIRIIFDNGVVFDWEIKRLTKKEFNVIGTSSWNLGADYEFEKKD